MKKTLLGFSLLALLSTPALSSANHGKDYKNDAMPEQSSWTGFYAGVNAGEAFSNANPRTTTVDSPTGYFATSSIQDVASAGTQKINASAFDYGIQGGYNYEFNNFILGLEADLTGTNLSGSQASTRVYTCCTPTSLTINQAVQSTWLFTARPRVGYSFGRLMIFATGGYARTNVTYKTTLTDDYANAHENRNLSQSLNGWAAGAGLEYQLMTHWSVRAEYIMTGLGNVTGTSNNLTAYTPAVSYPTNVFTHTTSFKTQLANFALNYRF